MRHGAISGALEAWLPGPLEGADAVRLEVCRRLALELDTGSTPAHAVPRLANALAALVAAIKAPEPPSGELDIAEFAPLSVKSEGDFAEILSQENPDIWRSNRPAQGGETGAMFDKIVAQAMQMRARESGGGTRDSKAGQRKARVAKAKTPKAATAKKSAIRRAKPKTKR